MRLEVVLSTGETVRLGKTLAEFNRETVYDAYIRCTDGRLVNPKHIVTVREVAA